MAQRKVPPPPTRYGAAAPSGPTVQQKRGENWPPPPQTRFEPVGPSAIVQRQGALRYRSPRPVADGPLIVRPSAVNGKLISARASEPAKIGGQSGAAQPFSLGAITGAVSSVAPWLAVAAVGAYTANVLVERQFGRNIIGYATYYTSDAVIQEVMDRALQAGIRPSSTQTFNGYTYSIDRFCRVYQVTGTVTRRPSGRVYGAVDPLVKAAGDHNGHIIADSLNGPIAACNFVGMTAYHNNAVGAGPDDDTYSRMEGAVRQIIDNEEKYDVATKATYPYVRATITINLTYPAWNAASRSTKLDYFRPNRLDVGLCAYTASHGYQIYDNPYLSNVVAGHMGVYNVNAGGDFNNTAGGGARYLVGDPGYP